ncbi:hypothetical protein FACS189472_12920 [Alphaproteobacteria bacterium]|nr:hypothetical protein FACS189472_12920 [Alphaproteobacteria bacterium]
MDTYTSAKDFLSNLDKYHKDTRIVTDYELKDGMNGFALAKLLYEKGYVNLYLLSGRSFRESEAPPYLTVIFKRSEDFTEKLL